MSIAPRRQAFVIGSVLAVTVAALALALPVGASARQAITPLLPVIVIVFGTLTGAWELVTGIIATVAHGSVDVSAAVALLLGVSAICMALAFLPPAPHMAPRLLPIIGAAIFAVAAAALQHRARVRSQL